MMTIFDALPENVRRAMADADFPWHPDVMARLIQRGARPASVAEMIRARTANAERRI
jgi:hypothetical protein